MALSDCFKAYLDALGIPKLRILKSILQSLLTILNIKKLSLGLSLSQLSAKKAVETAKVQILQPIYSAALSELDRISSTFIPGGDSCPQVSDMIEFVKDSLEKQVKPILDKMSEVARKSKAIGSVTAIKTRIDNLITFIDEVIVGINARLP